MKETIYEIPGPVRADFSVVADFHEGDPEPVLRILRANPPDCVLLPGDTLERHGEGHKRPLPDTRKTPLRPLYRLLSRDAAPSENGRALLRGLTALAPTFMSLGNHEWYLLPEDGIAAVLHNRDVTWRGIRIGGLSPWYDEAWLEDFRARDGYRILLCHQPEFYDRFRLSDFDLVLAGHAHGGQIRFAGRGLYAPDQGFFPRYAKGRYGCMIVSAGCANTARLPRLMNPPEILRIRMRPV